MKAATGEVVTAEELGGGEVHSRVSGVTDHLAEDDAHALRIVRTIVATLPRARPARPGPSSPPRSPTVDPAGLYGAVPVDSRTPYDVREVIARVVDGSRFAGVQGRVRARRWSPASPGSTATRSGIVANNGILFSESAQKGAHFIELCDQRGIPLVFLQNISGFMVGRDYEAGGIAKHGAKMVTAVACTRVPKLTVVIGGSYGAGNYSMCGRAYSPALPVDVAQRQDLGDGRRAGRLRPRDRQARPAGGARRGVAAPRTRRRSRPRSARSTSAQGNAYYATARLWDDGVIDPLETRQVLGLALTACANAPLPSDPRPGSASSGCEGTGTMTEPMFDTVLVANRGEIAVRVIRTLRRLGVRSVAVFTDADADARHVREADTAVRIGPAPPPRAICRVERLLEAAARTGAQAVHPGYGFLAENAAFARACADAGLVFIGPPADAIDLMGDKIRAKETVQAAGVPVVPGSSRQRADGRPTRRRRPRDRHAGAAEARRRAAAARACGWCGTRRLLADEIAAARREARASFGDDTLLVERWIDRPRHIEIQVLADGHGDVVHLGERECSLQRRHQKIIEEAPSVAARRGDPGRDGRGGGAGGPLLRLRGRGHGRVHRPGRRPVVVLLHGDEHPPPGRAPGHRAGHRASTWWSGSCGSRRASRCRSAQEDVTLHRARGRGPDLRGDDPPRGGVPALRRHGAAAARAAGRRGAHRLRAERGHGGRQRSTTRCCPRSSRTAPTGRPRCASCARPSRETVTLGVQTNAGFLRRLLAHPAVVAGELDTGLVEREADGAGRRRRCRTRCTRRRRPYGWRALRPGRGGRLDVTRSRCRRLAAGRRARLDGAPPAGAGPRPGDAECAVRRRARSAAATQHRRHAAGRTVGSGARSTGRRPAHLPRRRRGDWLGRDGDAWHVRDHDPVAAALTGGRRTRAPTR